MPKNDEFDNDEWRAFAEDAVKNMLPKLESSAFTVTIVPSDPSDNLDMRFCLQLGAMILLDKPIIAVVYPGRKVPAKLALVADEIVEMPDDESKLQERMFEAISRISARLAAEAGQ